MTKKILLLVFIAISSLLFWSCNSNVKTLYRFDDKRRISVFQLSDTSLKAVKQYLHNVTGKTIQDTVIIMYDYNNETCWNYIDEHETDDQLKERVVCSNSRITEFLATRPGVTFLEFRQPGENFNKIKKFNQNILIDKQLELYHFFFEQKNTCGNSIVLLPDGKYIFTRSDSHINSLFYSPKQITELLNVK
jgi:hypothetical protein